MRVGRTMALVAIGLFVSTQISSCGGVVTGVGGGNVSQMDSALETPDPAVEAKQSQMFLESLGKSPLRGQYPDSVLVAEARKVCHELYQSKDDNKVADMIRTDLGSDVDVDFFALRATLGFCPAAAPG